MNYKVSIVLILIAVLVGVSVATVYLSEASINYSLEVYPYQNIHNQWYTIDNQNNASSPEAFTSVYCQNKGLFSATFDITVKLTNATFSEKSFQHSQFIDNNTVKLSFTLLSLQKTYNNVPFTVDNNVSQFVISIMFHTNQPLVRYIETNWEGQSSYTYSYWENNIWAPSQIT